MISIFQHFLMHLYCCLDAPLGKIGIE